MNLVSNQMNSRRPGWSLEQPFYIDPDIYQLDLQHVYRTGWLFAGHACQIKKPGQYFCYEIAGDSLIIIRGKHGTISALYNVCRHRGSVICKKSVGQVNTLVCPYHQWTYDLDGKLLKNTWMPDDFVKEDFSLNQAHVRNIAGLIFVSLAEKEPLFEAGDDLKWLLDPQGLDHAKVAYTETYDIAANWKLIIENQRECYHCLEKHKAYDKIQFDADVDDPDKQEQIELRRKQSLEKWATLGLDVTPIDTSYAMRGAWWRVNRIPFRAGFVSESMDGQPVAPLMGQFTDYDVGNTRANTYPNFWLHGSSDHMHTMRVTPINATTTRIQADWLVAEDAKEGVDYDVARLIEFSKRVNNEDIEIVEDQAKGVNSSRYRPGPYSPIKEKLVEHFIAWYTQLVTEHN